MVRSIVMNTQEQLRKRSANSRKARSEDTAHSRKVKLAYADNALGNRV